MLTIITAFTYYNYSIIAAMYRTATIVGAGIGGLALGRALRAAGWQVKIHERSEGLAEAGTALGVWPEALEALDTLGLGDRVRDRGVLQRGAEFLRPDGTTFASVRPKQPSYLISRPALHEILYDSNLDESIAWRSPISDPNQLPQTDLLVGADGINSQLRELVAGGKSPPRPLGTVAFRGVVPGPVDSVTETWGDGRVFGITPQNSQTTNWFACVRGDLLTEYAETEGAELLGRLFHGWHPAITEILGRLGADQVERRKLYETVPLRSFVSVNKAVIGDAAHAMAPNLGRGACEALVDAVQLATSIRSAMSLPEGLLDYDRTRRRPAQRVARTAQFLNRLSTARRLPRVRRNVMRALARAA